mgnify:FL=1|jgi:hypothetical protein
MIFYIRGKKDWHIEPRKVHEMFKKNGEEGRTS